MREALLSGLAQNLDVRRHEGISRLRQGILSDEEVLRHVRAALRDKSPRLRARALEVLRNKALQWDAGELQPVLNDSHPLVQFALLETAQEANVALPAATLKALRESPVPMVARLAQNLRD
jgi:hypothetical protein